MCLKADIKAAVDALLQLKLDYKAKTGEDVPGGGGRKAKKAPKAAATSNSDTGADGSGKKQTRLGMEAQKNENLSDWYSQVY